MILQALKEYYDRKAADSESGIAPEGFQYKEIPFVIVIDTAGNLVQIKDTRRPVGKQLRAQAFLVPQEEKRAGKLGKNVKVNLLWDKAEYACGICAENSIGEEAERKHAAFINRVHLLSCQDEGVLAVLKFLGNNPIHALEAHEQFQEIKEANPFVSFQLNTDSIELVPQRRVVIDKIRNMNKTVESHGICLITGELGAVARLHPSIKGVRDANTTGGNIVSFNLSAFNSYGKSQGANAPIGEKAAFAYTTALNHLLRKNSNQKIQVGDASVVFWSDKESILENTFGALFSEPEKDNPDALTDAVTSLYKALEKGGMPNLEQTKKFYVLGLSPNAARISVRFWLVGTVRDFSHKIIKHFEGLNIVHADYEPDHLSLWRMLLSTAIQGKSENIAPNLAGEWMRTILNGLPYPDSLYQSVLRRIRADKEIHYPRAAIIKGYLNRKQPEKEVTVSLDIENKNVGYRLGRLFAVFEKIQDEAHGREINAGIKDRYYSAASTVPASVFSTLVRLKTHHIKKLDNKGRAINFEKLLGEILNDIVDFPAQLNLSDQGRFAIGYYHQRQDFFKKNESTNHEPQGE